VPVFCIQYDNYASVAARNAFLFDAIITVGCRAEEGPSSGNYQKLQSTLRERTASFILNHTLDCSELLESIQALIVVASYSEHGWLLSSPALRLAMQLSLPTAIDSLLTTCLPVTEKRVIKLWLVMRSKNYFEHQGYGGNFSI
jgi:hypothetical protein